MSTDNNKAPKFRVGLDVGSTTVKVAVLDRDNKVVYSSYERHLSDIRQTLHKVLKNVTDRYDDFAIQVTGSGGINAAEWLDIDFIQEVIAGTAAIREFLPRVDVAIELGGEDAKITYLKNGVEQRMNGTCAGGTGAFIDQMAALLATDASGLDKLAESAETIYPIASRCGVFAKTDIQPLINEGAARGDIAASIFQSVVNQTISGLACGKPIRGRVAFLGGPLHFLPQLGVRFVETLNPEEAIFPPDSQIFNAVGAALSAKTLTKSGGADIKAFRGKVEELKEREFREVERLEPLFADENELKEFRARHAKSTIPFADIQTHRGPAFLGIDAGSTTTKVALIDSKGGLLYYWYGANVGDPLGTVVKCVKEIYGLLRPDAYIGRTVTTGYGEHMIKAALGADRGEIETMAHQTASDTLLPGVEFILDIGGQDMKCLRVRDGVIVDILLNEACSSGCGSFIENFANALNMTASDFSRLGITSRAPVDLGSRCTVFMNSRVKQAQKEGASPADISAGLAYSVVKNALFKVIKLRDSGDLGDKIIVQGGTFLNECVLRAFEKVSGREVVRPELAGLMGAYGCAIIGSRSHESGQTSSLLNLEQLKALKPVKSSRRCLKCNNKCHLTILEFGDGKRYVSNNRCERGAEEGGEKVVRPPENSPENSGYNLYDYKFRRVFSHYKPLKAEEAPRGTVGIPRVLNLFENYPFWFTFFTNLGYRVELSPRSSRALFDKGIETMPSESVCYPAKIAHGHIEALIERGVKYIFYPCLPYEQKEDPAAINYYNCPIVGTYPEVIRINMSESIEGAGVRFHCPFLPYHNQQRVLKRLVAEFPDIAKNELKAALDAAYQEDKLFKRDIRAAGEKTLAYIKKESKTGIVVAGRPYHIDSEINHGIPEMISKYGFAVFTEDSISHLAPAPRLRVANQWMYHSRLYRAASLVRKTPNLELIQLNSFGCGPDAVVTDQVQELLETGGKIYTVLKIDEVNNLGAARIRVRSLMAVLEKRKGKDAPATDKDGKEADRIIFTQEMKPLYKILAPQMSPIHFGIMEQGMRGFGYDLEVLKEGPNAIETGLKYINNDSCYPSIISLGSIMDALLSGNYDLSRTAVLLAQTGGGCRATNYIPLLRKALKAAGIGHVPVISLNFVGLESNPGFKVNIKLLKTMIYSMLYGDVLMRCLYRVRPYETEAGAADRLFDKWHKVCGNHMNRGDFRSFSKTVKEIVGEFDALPLKDIVKPRVGLVGEILVKFHPAANNYAADLIEKEGGEVVCPDLTDFFLYTFFSDTVRYRLLEGSLKKKLKSDFYIWFVERIKKPMYKAFAGTKFGSPVSVKQLSALAKEIVSLGNIFGEGWFLTAEMLELMHRGVNNILCVQPFACLPNHVTGKGVIKALKEHNPAANIVAVDYDPGASEVNQINRIKLMMTVAKQNIELKTEN